jgi:hypothetical protein
MERFFFHVLGAVESAKAIADGMGVPVLSEQQLVDVRHTLPVSFVSVKLCHASITVYAVMLVQCR